MILLKTKKYSKMYLLRWSSTQEAEEAPLLRV